jgi:hypothetical protein
MAKKHKTTQTHMDFMNTLPRSCLHVVDLNHYGVTLRWFLVGTEKVPVSNRVSGGMSCLSWASPLSSARRNERGESLSSLSSAVNFISLPVLRCVAEFLAMNIGICCSHFYLGQTARSALQNMQQVPRWTAGKNH